MKPFRYPLARPSLSPSARENLLRAYDSGWISSKGEFIKKFEDGFASFVGDRHGVSTSNGTTALHLALAACGVRAGDEVVIPDFSFVAVANTVVYTGAKPVLADVNRQYWGLDVDSVKARLSKKTKAVVVVHLYGHPVDIDPIRELCAAKDLLLIEDCAEAHGARYKGRMVGTFGAVACFSFYGNKILTTGEGGMCLTKDDRIESTMRLLRDHGALPSRHFWHPVVGFNYRMTNLQAAIGCAQLGSLDSRIRGYRRVGKWYTDILSSAGLEPHPEMDWATCVYWMYTTMIEKLDAPELANLAKRLEREGIETRPSFYPISELPPYRHMRYRNPTTAYLSRHGLSLPTYYGMAKDDVRQVCSSLLKSIR